MPREQQQHVFTNFQDQISPSGQQPGTKKKRSLPGMPDPAAEIVALSPRTLLATNRFICEICNKGFQRDQNLQLHRRGHDLPWKLKQRTSSETRKRVYICPETSCVHHHPSRALGDLTGIKKHFCRKHGEKKWKCDKCSKKYAVQSDWKAHSKTCGTREYRCDCGILFSRRDSFITHRAFCDALAEESAKYSASNQICFQLDNHLYGSSIPSVGTFSQKSTFFGPSETLLMTGGSDILDSKTGKASYEAAAPAVAASWDTRVNTARYYSPRSFDERLPMCLGSRIEGSEGNGKSIQFKAMEETLATSKDDGHTGLQTYYGRYQYKGEGETLSSACRLEKSQDSRTLAASSLISAFQDSRTIPQIAKSSSRMDLLGIQKLRQQSPINLSLDKHDYVDSIGSKVQLSQSTNNAPGFALSSSDETGPPSLFGGLANIQARSFPFFKNPKFHPSRSQNSATALLQKATQMGARTSSTDLFKALDVEGRETTSIPESATCQRGMPDSASTLYSSQTLFGTLTGDTPSTCYDLLHNSSNLSEERRTWCNQLPTISDSGILNFINSRTNAVSERFRNLVPMFGTAVTESTGHSRTTWSDLDVCCNGKETSATEYKYGSTNTSTRGGSHSADLLEDSAGPFTRDFLGVTNLGASGMTGTVDLSSSRQDSLGAIARNESQRVASFGSRYWSSAGTNATVERNLGLPPLSG
ncbi:hypothetical protein O6H91_12G083800 [Diphasiastrum complanatum]|nr:hypothetical protein O6H91_12G083800 [Diphasiastrum complanatum]KAJ7536830.1 hypothetical protein O6H91_12G083800 [Diphasiastrum complanatum]